MVHVLHPVESASPARQVLTVVRSAGRFGLHLFEMCAAMCIGVAVLDVPFLALARAAGVSGPISRFPELAAVVVAFNMSAPMALWMRVRHHDRRCIREMVAAMFIEAFLLIAVAGVGVLPRESIVPWQDRLMIPAMVVVMLRRLGVYTHPVRHAVAT